MMWLLILATVVVTGIFAHEIYCSPHQRKKQHQAPEQSQEAEGGYKEERRLYKQSVRANQVKRDIKQNILNNEDEV